MFCLNHENICSLKSMAFMEIFERLSPSSDSVLSFYLLSQSNSKEPLLAASRPPTRPTVGPLRTTQLPSDRFSCSLIFWILLTMANYC
jgi:hypothetical protein